MEVEYTVGDVVKRGNPVVFFDITIGGHASGRIKMELFKDKVPKVRTSTQACAQALGAASAAGCWGSTAFDAAVVSLSIDSPCDFCGEPRRFVIVCCNVVRSRVVWAHLSCVPIVPRTPPLADRRKLPVRIR